MTYVPARKLAFACWKGRLFAASGAALDVLFEADCHFVWVFSLVVVEVAPLTVADFDVSILEWKTTVSVTRGRRS